MLKINKSEIYDYYLKESNKKLTQIESLIYENNLKIINIYSILKNKENIILKFFNKTVEDLLISIKDNTFEFNKNIKDKIKDEIPLFEDYVKSVKIYYTREYRLNQIKTMYSSNILDNKSFYKVINIINTRIIEHIILEEGSFNFRKLGTIKLVKLKRNYNRQNIDWATSNKLKKQLLEQGVKVREKGSKDGVNWLVKYTSDFIPYIFWFKSKDINIAYTFRPTNYEANCDENLKYSVKNKASLKTILEKVDLDNFHKISMGFVDRVYFIFTKYPYLIKFSKEL